MRGTVVVDTQADYDAWLLQQQTFAQASAPGEMHAAN
jgi:cytochrome c oxidase subunit 2